MAKRESPFSERMTVSLPPEVKQRLNEAARESGIAVAVLARWAVIEGLERAVERGRRTAAGPPGGGAS